MLLVLNMTHYMPSSNFTVDTLVLVLRLEAIIMFFLVPLFIVIVKFPGYHWQPNQFKYEWMIAVIYMALGACLYKAMKAPLMHGLFYDSVIWAWLFAHAGIMLVEAVMDFKAEWHHIMPHGDVPGLYFSAWLLWRAKSRAGVKYD